MSATRFFILSAGLVACFMPIVAAFVALGGSAVAKHSSSRLFVATTHEHTRHRTSGDCRRNGVQYLRAASSNSDEEGSGLMKSYMSFRKWQAELVSHNHGTLDAA